MRALFILLISISTANAAPAITAAALTPDGTQVLVGSQAGIEIRTWPDLNVVGKIESEQVNIHDIAFSANGQSLLIAGGSPGERGLVEVLSWPEKKLLKRIGEHSDVVYHVAWSPDGNSFATASGDGTCQVFETTTSKPISRFSGHSRAVLAIAWLPDGKTIISAGVDQTLQLWDGSTGKPIRSLDNHLAAVNDLAVRPTTNRDAPPIVASCSDDRTVRLWQPTIGRLMRFARLPSPVRCLAWSDDGTKLIVGCNDGSLQRIDPDTVAVTQLEEKLNGRVHALMAAKDRIIAAGEQGKLLLAK